ncbi:Wzz/FepE/Etk N-terminal domain-containing protein [Gemmobacter serpentinus]|uniref:Wzz/FepE/Etk N-terminal domain-containing protein n=1 Tax=Gemmobacter serpentinus TaxID=2652247 RepID=UPI00124DE9DB|nr:Wzz/FepE/Etk N-terminal domain-containing protein [Gemmobacter serpentinus]
MGPIQSIEEFVNLLLRRRLLIAVLVLLGTVVAIMLALSRSQSYEASAVIQVQTPVIDGQEQQARSQTAAVLQAIEQRLTTRENMLAMAERHGIFANAPGMSDDQKVNALRSAISLQTIAGAGEQAYGAPASVSALLITARLGEAEQTARVANDFAQSVLDMSVAQQASRTRETYLFFQTEEARILQQIAALESEIAAYKNAHLTAFEGDSATVRAGLDTDLRRIAQDMLALEAERSALQAKERLRETDRRRIEDLTAQIAVLDRQKAGLDAQRATLEQQAAQSPEVERTLNAYARQQEQLQSQFEMVTARKSEAETTLRLEQENHAEHFTLLERALTPAYPNGGGRKKIAIAGTMASLIGAIALAFILDLLNPVLRSAAQMQREVDIRPVIVVPDLNLRSPQRPTLLERAWDWVRNLPLPSRFRA